MESKAHMHLGHSSLRASPIHSIQHFAKKPRSPNFGKPIPNRFTETKFWETITEPFSWDQILGNQYRTVFLKSNLRKPIPNRFSNTKFFKTETGTHKKWQKSQKQEVSKPKCHSLHLTFCNRTNNVIWVSSQIPNIVGRTLRSIGTTPSGLHCGAPPNSKLNKDLQ